MEEEVKSAVSTDKNVYSPVYSFRSDRRSRNECLRWIKYTVISLMLEFFFLHFFVL